MSKKDWNPLRRFWPLNRDSDVPPPLATAGTESDPRHLAFLRSLSKEMRHPSQTTQPLDSLEVVAIDLETTGFHPQRGDEIISVGAVAVRGCEVLENECFYTLVQSNRTVPEHIELLTGITNDALREAPDLRSAMLRLFQFVGSRPMVAHHSRHERDFLRAALWKTSRLPFTHRLIDTMMMVQLSAGSLGNATLDTLCAINGIEIRKRHNAFYDALATAHLWSVYVQKAIVLGYQDLSQVYESHR